MTPRTLATHWIRTVSSSRDFTDSEMEELIRAGLKPVETASRGVYGITYGGQYRWPQRRALVKAHAQWQALTWAEGGGRDDNWAEVEVGAITVDEVLGATCVIL